MGRSLSASRPEVLDRPEVDDGKASAGGWIVTVFDNDTNTVDEVISILLIATRIRSRKRKSRRGRYITWANRWFIMPPKKTVRWWRTSYPLSASA